jgi:hypothetical protein
MGSRPSINLGWGPPANGRYYGSHSNIVTGKISVLDDVGRVVVGVTDCL